MEIFVKAKKLLKFFGFSITKDEISKMDIFRRFICSTVLVHYIISISWFVTLKASTFTEIVNPLMALTHCISCLLLWLLVFSRVDRITDLFDGFCANIQKRNIILNKSNQIK